MNKGQPKKFNFGFGNKKTTSASNESKRKATEVLGEESIKKSRSNTVLHDDEDDFLASAGIAKESLEKPAQSDQKEKEEEEEEDPLDAFMADISEQAKTQKVEPKIRRDDIEDEDELESYVRHMKEKGISVGVANQPMPEYDENANSDDEVYATAAAIDAQLSDNDEDFTTQANIKKEIEPLPRVDHDSINYIEIEKYFYEEHPDIAALDDARVQQIRKEMGVQVTGHDVAKPCISFGHFGFDEDLMNAIVKAGYTEPSVIQRQSIPVALEGRDIIGIAKTGSGKTAAFVLPMLIHIMDQEELVKGDGPIGLILAPTRELAIQIYQETRKFAKAYGLKVAAVYGGASKLEQFKDLRSGTVEILVATPGRLIDMIKMKATNLRRVSYLVLDEADRMFDLGFEPQVRSICDNVRPDRQTLLFSATFQKRIEALARNVTTDPVRIHVGTTGQANEDITQIVHVFEQDEDKWNWLLRHLPGFCVDGSVIIFVGRKDAANMLSNNLNQCNFACVALHGDLQQFEREQVLRDFKVEKVKILVATDVAARGLDIKAVKNVVNYDIARDIDSHIHRVGRTGRAGEKGTATTLITQKEDRFAGELVKHLEASGQPVSPELMSLAMKNPRFRDSRNRRGGRGGFRGRGRGRGRDRDRGRKSGGKYRLELIDKNPNFI
ncbi:P-loop containing nucleoside triphosphate hydrolase protein [Cokeromyces recurvatus]|uniref:P-loop containing nucleoside triphosphate hydrolase protein n=1 Tax=Cokeromyces recurvatus TaxID=90255 RepID=UPI00221F213B|nr:P-loop containing nucleoside triphosphate hydrolase protein [Cokeromyces recurvatus]KAI7898295.1 P-loop containing nucleoside triphosphate hydrolase protein [Cokeromyces recurvatus]